MRNRLVSIAFIFSFLGISAQNQKSPSSFFGYDIGTQYNRHHEVVDYLKHVAEVNPNTVKLVQYGTTPERRPLYHAFISSEENIKNLETIRKNNLKRTGLIEGEAEKDDIAIIWMSYNVHGNEASCTEAAINTIDKVLTKNKNWLENTVLIIDPCMNPDGRDKYVNWYNRTASAPYNPDQQASEHQEPWPGGRSNHYLFDLNRDWAWATQSETEQRLKVYNKWMPHIHVDFHEQGINEPYYFAPAAEPFHEVITDWQRDFQTQIGKNNAKYFDKNGWLYFTRERFDLFYPSYGDTYPTYLGAIGMTYEQAGHSRSGLGIINDEGDELTLVQRVEHHTTSGLSTIEMAHKNAEKLTSEFAKFFDNSDLETKSYVLQGHADKIQAVTKLLDKHEITYGFAEDNSKVKGYKFSAASEGTLSTTANDLIINTNQPKGKMVKVLFEPKAKLVDSLTYDITAWSVPYAYGLEAIASKTLMGVSKTSSEATISNSENSNATGYIIRWESMEDAKFLAALLKEDFRVRFSEKPISTQNKTFDRGSLIVVRGDNSKTENFDKKLVAIANKHQQELHAIDSGFSTLAPDFGSPDVKLVNAPKIALLSGKNTSSLSYGELWHFFEKQLEYPVTHLNSEYINRANLSKYNVLVMPNGYYGGMLNESMLKALKEWIQSGGKLIAFDGALRSFVGKDGFGLKRQKSKDSKDDAKKNTKLIPYANREREGAKNLITGAIFKTKIDNTHPLAFGYNNSYHTLKLGRSAYQYLENGYNVGYLEANPKQVSGFVGSNATKNLKETLIFGEQRMGQGSAIYFVDNVMFRSFWENGKLFFVNSLFFVNNNLAEL
ncbi:MAG: M14 family metallopeptidase [Bacteroidota bacterium]